MQIHTIELPKYEPLDNNGLITEPIEKWAWFFRFAQLSTPEQIMHRLGDEVFYVAAGIRQMISKTPRERMLYNARMKFQRDEASKLVYAQREGIAQGIAEGKAIGKAIGKAEGEQIGVIHFLQELLSLPETAEEKLSQMTTDSRDAIVADLKEQLRKRTQFG